MKQEYIVIAFTENQIGVLNRITSLYLRRKINIESLKVSESSIKGISMFVISAFSTAETMDLLVKQLRNIIDVILKQSDTADRLIRQLNARIIEFNPDYVVVEKTGTREEIDRMRQMLSDENLLEEFTRSGSVVLHRESWEDKLQGKI